MSLKGKGGRFNPAAEEHWIPLSDLMTGLMMMFLLIAVVFMLQTQADAKRVLELKERAEAQARKMENQADRMRRIAVVYSEIREHIYSDLQKEFEKDLPRWGAEIDQDLAVRFREPEVLFETGKADLRPRFAAILSDFFPRYLRILGGDAYKSSIEEIRIEGHTSSAWSKNTPPDRAYLLNMELSQSRTRSVLQYVLALPRSPEQQRWLIGKLTANGLSSSRLRFGKDGAEDPSASQRVEFRVRTNAEDRIGEVLKAAER